MQLPARALPSRPAAIVFDCDGLLLDTERAWARAESAVLAARGVAVTRLDRSALLGRTLPDVVRLLAARVRTTDLEGVRADLLAHLETDPEPPRPLPGARALVRTAAARLPVAIASNSSRTALDAALASSGLAPSFGVTVSADDVADPKPDPAPYLLAFDRLGVDAADVVVFEDSATGVSAARASGAFVVAVPSVPGVALPAHRTVRSLADRSVTRWAASLGPGDARAPARSRPGPAAGRARQAL